MKRVLLVEDDKALSRGISMALASDEIQIEQCFLLEETSKKTKSAKYDLLILDINLPDGNGLDFLKDWKEHEQIPVILLTANDMETDIVMGLEMGAADYITKPFSLAVLRARVHTQLRNQEQYNQRQVSKNHFEMDGFRFDFDQMIFQKRGQAIELSKTEQKLLRILVQNCGITLERSRLVDFIWTDGAEYVEENALSVTMKRLRDKLEDTPSKPVYMKTVYGIGYTWVKEKV